MPVTAPHPGNVAPSRSTHARRDDDPSSDQFTLEQIQRCLIEIVFDNSDAQAVIAQVADAVLRFSNAIALVYLERTDSGEPQVSHSLSLVDLSGMTGEAQPTWTQWAEGACQSGRVTHNAIGEQQGAALTVPVVLPDKAAEAFCLVFQIHQLPSERCLNIALAASAHLTMSRLANGTDQGKGNLSGDVVGTPTTATIAGNQSCAQLASQIANETKSHVNCETVIIGKVCSAGRKCRVVGLSDVSQFDRRSAYIRAIGKVLTHAANRGVVDVWTRSSEVELPAFQKLIELGQSEYIVTGPLHGPEHEIVGAWILAGDDQQQVDAVEQFALSNAAAVGARLASAKSVGTYGTRIPSLLRCLRNWRMSLTIALLLVVIAAMFVPTSYKLKCDSVVEPVTKRFAVSPFDGMLNRTFVEQGALVTQGDILATMDDRDIRWELTGLEANRARAVKRKDSAMANHKTGEAQIAAFEIQQLDSEISALRHRLTQLDIRSTIDGIIVSGVRRESQGAPQLVGDTLFEIAPLGKMVVEIAVPENEVGYVSENMRVLFFPDTFPGRVFEGEINSIQSRSEIRDAENVFIADVRIDNPGELLKPGMGGRSQIVAAPRAIGWILFHRPLEWIQECLSW
jgi:hypothetical protein